MWSHFNPEAAVPSAILKKILFILNKSVVAETISFCLFAIERNQTLIWNKIF